MFSCIEVLSPIVGRKKRAEHAKQLPKRFSLDILVREDDVDNCYPFIFPRPMTRMEKLYLNKTKCKTVSFDSFPGPGSLLGRTTPIIPHRMIVW